MPDDQENMVLMTIEIPRTGGQDLTLASVAKALGVNMSELDSEFGVVCVDPDRDLYAIMLAEDRVQDVTSSRELNVHGPFSDAQIAPFGPVKD